jgi:hypothetical protein
MWRESDLILGEEAFLLLGRLHPEAGGADEVRRLPEQGANCREACKIQASIRLASHLVGWG